MLSDGDLRTSLVYELDPWIFLYIPGSPRTELPMSVFYIPLQTVQLYSAGTTAKMQLLKETNTFLLVAYAVCLRILQKGRKWSIVCLEKTSLAR